MHASDLFTRLILISCGILYPSRFYTLGQDSAPQECMSSAATSVEPVACLAVLSPRLTVERQNGTATIYAVLQTSKAIKANTPMDLSISAPGNPAGMKLDEGGTGTTQRVTVVPAQNPQEVPVIRIHTSKDNATSGTLTYTLSLRTRDPTIKIVGSPKEVTVVSNP